MPSGDATDNQLTLNQCAKSTRPHEPHTASLSKQQLHYKMQETILVLVEYICTLVWRVADNCLGCSVSLRRGMEVRFRCFRMGGNWLDQAQTGCKFAIDRGSSGVKTCALHEYEVRSSLRWLLIDTDGRGCSGRN